MPRTRTPVVMRRLPLLALGLLVACVATNPEYDPISSETDPGPSSGTKGASPPGDGATSSSAMAEDKNSGSSSASAGWGDTEPSTSTGWMTSSGDTELGDPLEPSELGQSCAQSNQCAELGAGVECCETKQCLGTCMVPCTTDDECPFASMGCKHSYCLFPCDDDDDDCSDWPGFTCQHGGKTFCEND